MTYDPGVTWTVDNITYGISVPMGFDNWTLGSHWMSFNGLGFNLTSSNNIFINYSYFRSHPKSTTAGDILFRFNASTVAGTSVTFNISGLKSRGHYYLSNDTSMVPFLSSLLGSVQWVHNTWSSGEFFLTDAVIPPTVVTNVSTGVEETNATLWGYLESDGGESCYVRFQYGTTTAYGPNTMNQMKSSGDVFSADVTGLTKGQLYHFRAFAENSNGRGYGIDRTFLTKPNEPTGLIITNTASGVQTLSWVHGTGYNRSVVRGTIGSYPSTPQSGTAIYNDTGATTTNSGLTGGNVWYYRVWEFSTWDGLSKFSDTYTQGTLTAVVTPTVTTNDATGVEETNATLNGYVIDDGGGNTSSLFENYTTGDDAYYSIYEFYAYSQTFTPIIPHNITSIKLLLYKIGLPGIINIDIKETDGVGKPTGAALTTGTINGNTITSSILGLWYEISLTSHQLNTGTKYAIVLSLPAYVSGSIRWRYDDSSPAYVGGSALFYDWTVPSWTIFSSDDCMFKEYGTVEGCFVYFQYGLTTSYGTNTSSQIKSTGEIFNASMSSLTQGLLYHYRAVAANSNGKGYGIDRTFLTKPNPPSSIAITSTGNGTQTITWAKGTGANRTVIRAKIGSYPADPQSETSIYNGTGTTTTVVNTILTPGKPYYYRAWSYTPWGTIHQFSDQTNNITKLTQPYAPTNATLNLTTYTTMNLTWDAGHGANKTMIRSKATGFPTSPTDGDLRYNGTHEYYNMTITPGVTYYFTAFSYTEWITPALSIYSYNRTDFTNITGGGIVIYCYEEGTSTGLTFNVLISNPLGNDTQYNTSCTNPFSLNTAFCPFGDDIGIWISASGYRTRVYTRDFHAGIFLVLYAYLPRNTTTGTGGSSCSPQAFMDSMSINATVRNYVIPLTYRLHTMIEVQVYNKTLGYWVTVPTNMWINNSNQSVTIKSGVLDSHNWNITMGRVSYYYLLCAEEQLSFLYNLRVIETIESEYTTTDYGVEDAYMQIKRYDNITDIFVTISSLYTDANGYINLYLIPNVLHKVTISKAGYDTVTSDYYPTPPNAYGQTAEKIFKIIRSANGTTPIVYDDFWTTVVFTAAMNSTNATHIYYHDRSGNTINTQIYFYEFYMGITTFLFSDSKVGNQSFYWNITGLNKTRVYIAVLCFNTTNNFNLPENSVTVTIWPLGPFNNNTKFDIEERITDVFGEFKIGPQVFTWIGFFLSLIPLIILTLFDPANVGIGILTTGFFMAGVQIGLAAWTINSVNMLTVVLTPVVIFIGVLYILAQRQGLGNL